jgi:hypothetical protein
MHISYTNTEDFENIILKLLDIVWSHFMRGMRSLRPCINQNKFWNTCAILANFYEIRIISNFAHKVRLY